MPNLKKKKTWEKPSVKVFGSAAEVRAFYASRLTAAGQTALNRLLGRAEGEKDNSEKDIRRRRFG